jgi:hypothetical protein
MKRAGHRVNEKFSELRQAKGPSYGINHDQKAIRGRSHSQFYKCKWHACTSKRSLNWHQKMPAQCICYFIGNVGTYQPHLYVCYMRQDVCGTGSYVEIGMQGAIDHGTAAK